MDRAPRIVAFAGSLRRDSLNKKLVRVAAEGARKAGGEVELIDLKELALPLYDADDEAEHGLPEGARRFKRALLASDGLLIASPEYNSSVTAALKNALDWASRAESTDEPPLAAFAGKTAALMSASPGALGGLRGLVHLRAILGNIKVIVLPEQKAVPQAHAAFDDAGELEDAKLRQTIEGLGARLVEVASRLG